ncbi:hypothetical protein [Aquibacillus kalidii]|uniref:hypothetical protein n=1 Tax=Aquibacillus kalidii TaxID=2762597 RepID=UPI00164772E8|nr:hypothetical protein [Aquibacillus kalidii]
MGKWREKRKARKQRRKNHHEGYSLLDGILDILFWIPEILLVPFRILYWLFRGIGKWIENIFDIV